MTDFLVLKTVPEKDYELLDSGENEKLERFGKIIVRRPDPQALWPKLLSATEWKKAQAFFDSTDEDAGWKFAQDVPKNWRIEFDKLNFLIRPSAFKHLGIFPEQMPNWTWFSDLIGKSKKPVFVLNLFAYTGGATLAAAQAGASVCHVDGSKVAVNWAKENAKISQLDNKPIRWIIEDVLTFVKREARRGRMYDGIIMDPPAFGHGPKKELWKIEKDFLTLLSEIRKILSPQPLFFLINGYASGYSAIAYENNLKAVLRKFNGHFEKGELTIEEKTSGRLLPCGIFSRWENNI